MGRLITIIWIIGKRMILVGLFGYQQRVNGSRFTSIKDSLKYHHLSHSKSGFYLVELLLGHLKNDGKIDLHKDSKTCG